MLFSIPTPRCPVTSAALLPLQKLTTSSRPGDPGRASTNNQREPERKAKRARPSGQRREVPASLSPGDGALLTPQACGRAAERTLGAAASSPPPPLCPGSPYAPSQTPRRERRGRGSSTCGRSVNGEGRNPPPGLPSAGCAALTLPRASTHILPHRAPGTPSSPPPLGASSLRLFPGRACVRARRPFVAFPRMGRAGPQPTPSQL